MSNHLAPAALTVAYYQALLAEHGRKAEAVGWTKAKEWRRYAALINSWVGHTDTVLDYGCGLGHMGIWMHGVQHRMAKYHGVDVVPEFIASNKEAFKDNGRKDKTLELTPSCFSLIESAADVKAKYDHVILCGVFNFNAGDAKAHNAHIQETLARLFDNCRIALHVDFLAPDADYKDPHHHHQGLHDLVNFLAKLSKRYVIDRSYLPFEYCVHIRRDEEVEPKDNTFKG